MTPPASSFASLSSPAAAAINHLLAAEPWAQRALLAHAGKVAIIDLGVASLRLGVGGDGMLEAAARDAAPDVTIHVKPADVPLILQNRDRAFGYVTVDGDAGFANTISRLAESLRWEAEADLSRLVGDIAAVRLVSAAKAIAGSLQAAQRTMAENTAEYLADEKPVLVRSVRLQQLTEDVSRLRDDVERLSKRIERLKKGAGR